MKGFEPILYVIIGVVPIVATAGLYVILGEKVYKNMSEENKKRTKRVGIIVLLFLFVFALRSFSSVFEPVDRWTIDEVQRLTQQPTVTD